MLMPPLISNLMGKVHPWGTHGQKRCLKGHGQPILVCNSIKQHKSLPFLSDDMVLMCFGFTSLA